MKFNKSSDDEDSNDLDLDEADSILEEDDLTSRVLEA